MIRIIADEPRHTGQAALPHHNIQYMQAKAVKKKENIGGGFDIGNINAGSELYYPNICGMKNKTKIHFLTASMQEDSWIEIWDNLEEKENRSL